MRIEGMHLNIIKAVHDKATANITLNGEKLQVFPLRQETRQMFTVTSYFQHSIGNPTQSN